jgi:hypothetical protein
MNIPMLAPTLGPLEMPILANGSFGSPDWFASLSIEANAAPGLNARTGFTPKP